MEKKYGDVQTIVKRSVGLVAIQRMVFSRKSRRSIIMYRIPDAAKWKRGRLFRASKIALREQWRPLIKLYRIHQLGINAAVSGQLPTVVNLKQTLRQVRHQIRGPLPNVTNLQKLTMSAEYNTMLRGDAFLLHDSGPGQQRFLIFSTARNLELLSRCPNWYTDGTFKTAPPLFQQICSIHVLKHGTILPVVLVLMSDHSTYGYV